MKLIERGATHVLVEMEPGEAYPGYIGAHTYDYPPGLTEAREMFRSIDLGNARSWTWDTLMHYTWGGEATCVAVISLHDWNKLTIPEENEWGPVGA